MMRRFGVELECYGPEAIAGRQYAATQELLRDLGLPVATSTNHYATQYEAWQTKHDGTLRPANRAVEVVSRIMAAEVSSYEEIKRVCDALTAAGYDANSSCGLHVHLNVSDLPFSVAQLVALRYNAMAAEFDTLMPESRRTAANNTWCHHISAQQRTALVTSLRAGTNDQAGIGHYHMTNLDHAYVRNGTNRRIEFRQFGGSVDAAKVVGWVKFLQEFVQEIARRAAGLDFTSAAAGMSTAPIPAVAPPTPIIRVRVPRLRTGSDSEMVARALIAGTVLTYAWATERNIPAESLRRIVGGFRRHGAFIVTTSGHADGPRYYAPAAGRIGGITLRELFTPEQAATPVSPVPARDPMPVSAAPAAPTASTVDILAFVAYAFEEGLSAETRAWIATRRDLQRRLAERRAARRNRTAPQAAA